MKVKILNKVLPDHILSGEISINLIMIDRYLRIMSPTSTNMISSQINITSSAYSESLNHSGYPASNMPKFLQLILHLVPSACTMPSHQLYIIDSPRRHLPQNQSRYKWSRFTRITKSYIINLHHHAKYIPSGDRVFHQIKIRSFYSDRCKIPPH